MTANAKWHDEMIPTMPKPKAVMFDWDGTIVDSIQAIFEGYNEVCRAYDRPEIKDHHELHEVMSHGPARQIFQRFIPDHADAALDLYYTRVPALRAQHLGIIPHIKALLETLHGQGIKLAVVSNMNYRLLADEMKRVGLEHYFSAVVGAGETALGKPSPEPVFLAAERLGLSRDDLSSVWFVGDMEPDMRAAAASGCSFLLYDPEGSKKHLISHHVISSYGDFDVMAKQILSNG